MKNNDCDKILSTIINCYWSYKKFYQIKNCVYFLKCFRRKVLWFAIYQSCFDIALQDSTALSIRILWYFIIKLDKPPEECKKNPTRLTRKRQHRLLPFNSINAERNIEAAWQLTQLREEYLSLDARDARDAADRIDVSLFRRGEIHA